jgi:RNA polymerase sigma-70 factor, ECF subfamily
MSASKIQDLIEAFRSGDLSAGNRIFQQYMPWLKLLARVQVESRFQAKFDPSDIAQQAMLEAVKAFPQFRGSTEAELRAWLRQVLAHALAHEIRRYAGTQKRALDREISLDQEFAQTSQRLENILAATGTSPAGIAAVRDEQLLLASVMEQLPDDYREVLILRHFEGLSHEEAARRMNRNPGAVRMLWVRALARLRQELNREISQTHEG